MSIWLPILQQLLHNLGGDTMFHWIIGALGGFNGGGLIGNPWLVPL